jgi:hypothetical protein
MRCSATRQRKQRYNIAAIRDYYYLAQRLVIVPEPINKLASQGWILAGGGTYGRRGTIVRSKIIVVHATIAHLSLELANHYQVHTM